MPIFLQNGIEIINVAIGKSRKELNYVNLDLPYSEFIDKYRNVSDFSLFFFALQTKDQEKIFDSPFLLVYQHSFRNCFIKR